MEFVGIELDNAANDQAVRKSDSTKISTDASKVAVYVIPTNEELVIARDTAELIGK
jgi:acetate kinase